MVRSAAHVPVRSRQHFPAFLPRRPPPGVP
jgi:hypothetical protein